MKKLLCLIGLFAVSSGCELNTNKPRKFEISLHKGYDVCLGVCGEDGIKDIMAKIITGTPTTLTVTCICNDGSIDSWTRKSN
jgi:hypothetical protein